ncbi:cupredoxin domain-containing protein [Lactiplantibacillus garii]|uniref:Cupredoxin domain-containing protein n=1 Tax=Lactiplantibacillus garii TaxID=2306423 RepID=A0A426D4D4_9LACO|nr:cupredoxin domain-containing protein [Lactiplantibacillus garii]RRK09289.1 cupredoxin domain-containing protein [Lactiplantibacillus garii]
MDNKRKQRVNVTVKGGYEPAVVELQRGVPAELTFTRTSAQGCLDVVHSTALGFEAQLPLDEPQTVEVPTDQAGDFDFSCGMDMFHGKVVIKG